MNSRLCIPIFAGLLLFSACAPVDDEIKYEEKVVVFGNLKANFTLADTIYVSKSYDIDQPHEAEANWITDADVSVKGRVLTHPFQPVEGAPGRYIKKYVGERVMPNKSYSLSVKWQEHTLTSETTIPDTVHISSVSSSDYSCGGEGIIVPSINLYLNENTTADIRRAIYQGDFSQVKMDTVTYREGACYSASFASIPMFILNWEAESDPGMMRIVSYSLEDDVQNAIIDTSFAANIFKDPMMVDKHGNLFRQNPIVWHLSQKFLDFSWMSFNYTGVHLIEVQVADCSFQSYYRGFPIGPPQNQYIMPESNIDGGYGLFSSTYSRYFLVYVKMEAK